ncbi:MAG: hypothetical protein QXO70_03220 [Candidatus Pacearchaeota archaeon]
MQTVKDNIPKEKEPVVYGNTDTFFGPYKTTSNSIPMPPKMEVEKEMTPSFKPKRR